MIGIDLKRYSMKKAINFNLWRTLLIVILTCGVLSSCGKLTEDFLNVPQNPSVVIPKTIRDYQALLDAAAGSNSGPEMNSSSCHRLGMAGGEEFLISDQVYNSLSTLFFHEKQAYSWSKDIYGVVYNTSLDDWYLTYKRVLYTNLVLDGIGHINPVPSDRLAWNNVRGSALFFRALNFYDLAQLFCKHYDPTSAKDDLGIVLRTNYDVTVESHRATVEQTYHQIIQDLEEALPLLPLLPGNNFRPSQAAVHALLMRVHLTMGHVEKVVDHANAVLKIHDTLNDFNEVNLTANITFPVDFGGNAATNPEIFFYRTGTIAIGGQTRMNISLDLLNSYASGDLRPAAFFRRHTNGNMIYKGSYSGSLAGTMFTGFAASEIWITRAEAYARLGRKDLALADLNHLLRHRYNSESFEEVETTDAEQALSIILDHRRKEMIFRGTRWTDLRRLNTDPRFAQTLSRVVNGVRHELPPGDLRWVWPIPPDEIDLSKIEQNPR